LQLALDYCFGLELIEYFCLLLFILDADLMVLKPFS